MQEQSQQNESLAKTRIVTKIKYPLPNPDLSFDRHWEILKAYVVASKEGNNPVSYKDFGKLTVAPTTISGNNKFFEHIGFISKVKGARGKYLPTQEAIDLCNDRDWNKEANVKSRLTKLLNKTWFGQSVKDLLTIKKKINEDELLEHLGYESKADPKKRMSSLKIIIEYLKYSEIIKQHEGTFILGITAVSEDIIEKEISLKVDKIDTKSQEKLQQISGIDKNRILFGVLINPEMTEDQIRIAIRIILEEVNRL